MIRLEDGQAGDSYYESVVQQADDIGQFLAAAVAAKADVVFSLDQSGCNSGCWVNAMGTFTLQQPTPDVVILSLSMISDYTLPDAAGRNHHTFVFNLLNSPVDYTASHVVSGSANSVAWSYAGPAAVKDAPFGSFAVYFDCTACQEIPLHELLEVRHIKPGLDDRELRRQRAFSWPSRR